MFNLKLKPHAVFIDASRSILISSAGRLVRTFGLSLVVLVVRLCEFRNTGNPWSTGIARDSPSFMQALLSGLIRDTHALTLFNLISLRVWFVAREHAFPSVRPEGYTSWITSRYLHESTHRSDPDISRETSAIRAVQTHTVSVNTDWHVCFLRTSTAIRLVFLYHDHIAVLHVTFDPTEFPSVKSVTSHPRLPRSPWNNTAPQTQWKTRVLARTQNAPLALRVTRSIDPSPRFMFARFRSMMIRHRRRRRMALVAVHQPAPATIYAINTSLSDRLRWWLPRPE